MLTAKINGEAQRIVFDKECTSAIYIFSQVNPFSFEVIDLLLILAIIADED